MKTIIKWPGGKSKELNYVRQLIPKDFDRYIEPFFGGGAVYFDIEPKKAIINDRCKELILFYKYVKDDLDRESFKVELYRYVDCWEKISNYMEAVFEELLELYLDYRQGLANSSQMKERVLAVFTENTVAIDNHFNINFTILPGNLLRQMSKNTIAKLSRIMILEEKQGCLSTEDLMKNIETAIRSGFYMHFRDLLNTYSVEGRIIPEVKKVANYYFIREFCYGSMFRFSSKGEFNIPYGGIGYNRKNFRKKVDLIFSEKTSKILSNTIIETMDFEDFFQKYILTDDDFVFLDPPYDSDFSKYEQNSFTLEDQIRLSKCLVNLNAKFILIIKKTDFIMDLYRDKPGVNITSFEKTYLYNVRGRNNRKTEHLLICNY
ncbi:MAG: hypothetical protein APF76_17140 [Desulfitibacter sp. BRH_c19]|nr:MAG: hypothetical protein APF76_17140 [Desulfitibacter sp. BRH_c19]